MELQDYLAECTVRIDAAASGTGFFLAPGLIVTPAHVVEDPEIGGYPCRDHIRVTHRGTVHAARLERYAASPSPDLAILAVEIPEHGTVQPQANRRCDRVAASRNQPRSNADHRQQRRERRSPERSASAVPHRRRTARSRSRRRRA